MIWGGGGGEFTSGGCRYNPPNCFETFKEKYYRIKKAIWSSGTGRHEYRKTDIHTTRHPVTVI